MIRVAVIGCGKIAQVRHLPEYATNPNAQLVAYYDKNSQRAHEVAAQYGGKVYDSYFDLLKDPEIDAVSVCVENRSHAEMTTAALYAGKHVLCEKPMAVTLAECESMVAAAEFNNRHLMIGHNMRFDPVHRRAKELLFFGDDLSALFLVGLFEEVCEAYAVVVRNVNKESGSLHFQRFHGVCRRAGALERIDEAGAENEFLALCHERVRAGGSHHRDPGLFGDFSAGHSQGRTVRADDGDDFFLLDQSFHGIGGFDLIGLVVDDKQFDLFAQNAGKFFVRHLDAIKFQLSTISHLSGQGKKDPYPDHVFGKRHPRKGAHKKQSDQYLT